MEKEKLRDLLMHSYKKETCQKKWQNEWSIDNPTIGQSDITALIVNDFFGGKIYKHINEDHYYNLIDNEIIDLTNEESKEAAKEINREILLQDEDIKNRYKKLLYNLKQAIRMSEGKKFKLTDEHGKIYLSDTPGQLGGHKKLKIYGRLDCPSANRWVEKGKYANFRVFFADEETAIKAGFRPCGICMPQEYKAWKDKQKTKKLN